MFTNEFVMFEQGDIITLKLSSGEEIIASFIGQDCNFFQILKPFTIGMTAQGIGMTQSMISMNIDAEEVILLPKRLVIMYARTRSDLAQHYTANTSRIQVVPKSVLLG